MASEYLELAYYFIHGRCPPERAERDVLNESSYSNWNEFFRDTSAVLNSVSVTSESSETCFCHRRDLLPHGVDELRTFQYRDVEARIVKLSYVQYFNEAYRTIADVFDIVDSLAPTHVVLNWGAWFDEGKRADMMQWAPPQGVIEALICPRFDGRMERPYRMIWATDIGRVNATGHFSLPYDPTLPLNVPATCGLPDTDVMDRFTALQLMEPNASKQMAMRLNDGLHLNHEANHAMNTMLTHMFSGLAHLSAGGPDVREVRSSWLPRRRAWFSGRTG